MTAHDIKNCERAQVVYSTFYEVIIDFTRDYDQIRQALPKLEHYDKTNLETVLQAVNNILISNWGSQNYCQVLVFTDCGVGLGPQSLKNTVINLQLSKKQQFTNTQSEKPWLPFDYPSKLSFICLGTLNDAYFKSATSLYQQLLDISEQKGQLFIPKSIDNVNNALQKDDIDKSDHNNESNSNIIQFSRHAINDVIDQMCEANFKQFEAVLNAGSHFKLECSILIWPPPAPYTVKEDGNETIKTIAKKIEISGYISLADIGSPMSVSRHLIFPKAIENEKLPKSIEKSSNGKSSKQPVDNSLTKDLNRLEAEIKNLYAKTEGNTSEDETAPQIVPNDGSGKESVCVLLHGALKVENMAALVLLNDDWFGFIYSYADSKKKSNLMLTILPPGHDIIPWLGDLRYLGTIDDACHGENPAFPVKPDKRSYSQNCVVWIRHTGLQSDIQKVLRHAKKLPEKTQHFYKELNRIRRAALSLGFVELLEGLANIFEREIVGLPASSSPDCSIQLKHVAKELRKPITHDFKGGLTALPTKYNQIT